MPPLKPRPELTARGPPSDAAAADRDDVPPPKATMRPPPPPAKTRGDGAAGLDFFLYETNDKGIVSVLYRL